MAPRRACVIGYPIKHSRSPLIHAYWLAEHGIDGAYGTAEVAPQDFAAFVGDLPAQNLVGANVTVPHKEAAFRLAEVEDPVALSLEAANLVWVEGGRLKAANTDVAGFLANLDEARPGWSERLDIATVIGAGGAARAVIHALTLRGAASIRLVNRTRQRAEELAARFGPHVVPAGWDEAGAALDGASLLVNTSSLGMLGQPPLDLDLAPLRKTALVTDLVYVPLETDLLRRARASGRPTVDGLGMLLHQAVPAFERFFGVRPRVTRELRALVVADLAGPMAP